MPSEAQRMQKVHELGAVSILMDILEIGYFEEDTFNIFLQNLQNLIEFQSQRVMIQETQQMLLEVKTKTKKKKTKFGHQGPEFIEDKNKSNGGGEHQAEDVGNANKQSANQKIITDYFNNSIYLFQGDPHFSE